MIRLKEQTKNTVLEQLKKHILEDLLPKKFRNSLVRIELKDKPVLRHRLFSFHAKFTNAIMREGSDVTRM